MQSLVTSWMKRTVMLTCLNLRTLGQTFVQPGMYAPISSWVVNV